MQDKKMEVGGGDSSSSRLCWAPDQSHSDAHLLSALASHISQWISLSSEEFRLSRDFPLLIIQGQFSLMETKQREMLWNSHFGDSKGVADTHCLEDDFSLRFFNRWVTLAKLLTFSKEVTDTSLVFCGFFCLFLFLFLFFCNCQLMKQIIAKCIFWVLEQQVKWIKSLTHGSCILGQGDEHKTHNQINIEYSGWW